MHNKDDSLYYYSPDSHRDYCLVGSQEEWEQTFL